jgi:hypothetical protein
MVGLGLRHVTRGLASISKNPAATSRLAAVSAKSTHGECTSASEIAYAIWRTGGDAERETKVGNLRNVDLVSADEAFEIKSKIWESADRPDMQTFTPTDDWFGLEYRPKGSSTLFKLMTATVPGYLIVTIATPLNFRPHRLFRTLRNLNHTSIEDRLIERGKAIKFYQSYGDHIGADPAAIQHIELGVGSTPDAVAIDGKVALDVVIIAVPAGSRATPKATPHGSTDHPSSTTNGAESTAGRVSDPALALPP